MIDKNLDEIDLEQVARLKVKVNAGSTEAKRREPKSCFGQVFNFKLGCFYSECNSMV
jgi:hypothetical protein